MGTGKRVIPLVILALLVGCSAPGKRVALAFIRVHARPPLWGGCLPSAIDAEELHAYRVHQAAQVNLLQSHLVIQSALRTGDTLQIPQIVNSDNPVEWVKRRLEANFPSDGEIPGNGEIMEVRVSDDSLSDEQLRALADAICEAFVRQVAEAERLGRQEILRQIGVLRKEFSQLQTGLHTKREAFLILVADLDHAPAFDSAFSDAPATTKLAEKRDEVRRLERLVDETGQRIALLNMESSVSSRVQILSTAVIAQASDVSPR